MPVTMEMLDELFTASILELTEKIKAGQATAGDFAAAFKVLRDNGVVLKDDQESPEEELNRIVQKFAFEDVEDYDVK